MKLRNILTSIVLLLVYVIAFTAAAVSDNMWSLKKVDTRFREVDQGYIYISLQQESNPLEMSDTPSPISLLSAMYDRLAGMNICTYYEIYRQSLDYLDGFGSYYDYASRELTGQEGSAMCVQISENVQKDFGLSVFSGRLLNREDFAHESDEPIPVLLGYGYSEMHQLGDIFTAEYLFNEYSFEVVGFLEKEAGITMSTGSINLDEYIIMPSVDFEDPPRNETEYVSQLIHYANKTSGKIRTSPEECEQALSDVQEIIESSDTGVYSVATSSLTVGFTLTGLSFEYAFVAYVFLSVIAIAAALFLTIRRVKNYYIKPENRERSLFIALIKNIYLAVLTAIAALAALVISYIWMGSKGYALLAFHCIYLCIAVIFAIFLSVVLMHHRCKTSENRT